MLPTRGEVPGFTASGTTVYPTVDASVTDIESAHDVSADPGRLRAAGFRQGVSQLLSRPDGQSDGVAYVAAFDSPEGAVQYRTYLHRDVSGPSSDTGPATVNTFIHFTVPGVPNAAGGGIISQVGQGVTTNVVWTEGDCMISLAIQSQSAARPQTGVLIAGTRAIYRRTKGNCTA
jgi:hypothetical protein